MWEFVEIYLTYEGCLSVWSYYVYCWSELLHTQCFFFFFYFQVEEVGLMVPSITLKSLLRVDLLKKYHLYFMGYEITKKNKIEVEFDVWRSCVDKVPSSAAVSMEEGWREKGCINHLHSGLLSLFMKGWSVWKKPSKSRIYFFSFWKCFYIKLKSLKQDVWIWSIIHGQGSSKAFGIQSFLSETPSEWKVGCALNKCYL